MEKIILGFVHVELPFQSRPYVFTGCIPDTERAEALQNISFVTSTVSVWIFWDLLVRDIILLIRSIYGQMARS